MEAATARLLITFWGWKGTIRRDSMAQPMVEKNTLLPVEDIKVGLKEK
jgi:hypothetical protein